MFYRVLSTPLPAEEKKDIKNAWIKAKYKKGVFLIPLYLEQTFSLGGAIRFRKYFIILKISNIIWGFLVYLTTGQVLRISSTGFENCFLGAAFVVNFFEIHFSRLQCFHKNQNISDSEALIFTPH